MRAFELHAGDLVKTPTESIILDLDAVSHISEFPMEGRNYYYVAFGNVNTEVTKPAYDRLRLAWTSK